MSVRILHLGADLCHRAGVLTSAGFQVEECPTIEKLREAFQSECPPDAVVVVAEHGRVFHHAVTFLREHKEIPVILFGEPQRSLAESEFDLVIPNLASPDAWLPEVAALIAQGQVVRIRRKTVEKQASFNRRDSNWKVAGD